MLGVAALMLTEKKAVGRSARSSRCSCAYVTSSAACLPFCTRDPSTTAS